MNKAEVKFIFYWKYKIGVYEESVRKSNAGEFWKYAMNIHSGTSVVKLCINEHEKQTNNGT